MRLRANNVRHAVSALAVGIAAVGALAEPARRGPEPPASIVFHLTRPAEVTRVEAVLPDPGQARAARRPVTDLMLLLTADDGDVESALRMTAGIPGSARLYRARLAAVIGGRIYGHATAYCGGWRNEISTCRVACDGGVFAVKRSMRGDEPVLEIVVGAAATGDSPEESRVGVLLSACDRDSGPEVRLVPSGTAPSAALALARD